MFHDVVYGDIEIDYDELDEGVLLKSDGFPTYNFANVIDDHLMAITHVVRGNEYISSTPKYNLIYEAFGWTPPIYVHVAQVMKDAQHKLSKRNGDASFQDLVAKGYLPAAILNYIALLGWNPGTEQEIFSLAELEQVFDAERLNKSPAIFDIAKLRWMNGCYIRALPFAEFHALACKEYDKFITRSINREELSKVLQPRVETLNDIAETAGFIETLPAYGEELFNNKKMKTDPEIAKKSLQLALPALESLSADGWNNESLFECLKAVAAANGLKNGQVLYPVSPRPDRAGNNPRRRQRNCRGSGQGRNLAPHKTGTLGTLPQSPTTAPPQSPTTVPPQSPTTAPPDTRHCSLPVLLLCGLFVFPFQSPAPVLYRANHALPFSPPVPVPRPVFRRTSFPVPRSVSRLHLIPGFPLRIPPPISPGNNP